MDQNGRNDIIRDLIIEVLENGLTDNITYIKIIEALDNYPSKESDVLVFLLEYLNLNTLALDLIIDQYKIKRVREVLSLRLEDFQDQNQRQINEKNENFFSGPVAEQVFKE